MITLKLKIGKGMLEYQANHAKDIHKFSAIYGALPEICGLCQSSDIFLSHKSPKGNDYYTVTCKSCGAELTLHQKKEGGFYLKYDDKFVKYEKTEQTSKPDTQSSVEGFPDAPENNPDVPF